MPEHDPLDQHVWESGWDAHELAQRRRLASLTLAEKLAWLEDADRVVRHLRRGRGGIHSPEPGSETPE